MSLINREILHFKHAPNVTQERELEGLPNYEAIRPASLTNDDDFSCILNFFRKIIDETKLDGVKYANTSLLKHHIGHFCLNSGTVLFKIVEKKRGSGVAELYGYFTPLSEARTMWLDISKLFYQLTVEMPGSAQNAPFDYEKLQALSVNDIKNAQPIYRSSMENMLSELQNSAFPMNAVLSSLPESFYPSGVKVFPNGMVLEKTDGVQKEVLLSFDDAQISTHMKECNEPLKSASLASVPYVDDDKKSGGLFKLKKNDKTTAKAINQWYYKYTTDGQAQQQNCDFIKLNKPLEYSPVSDTFAAYTGRLGANADVLPVVESATVYVPPASETKAMVVTSVGTPPPLQKQSTPELSSAPPPKPTLPSSPKAVKPPKPSKPEKKKPVGKVHPLLAQAEEREEATTVATKPAKKAPPPTKPSKPEKKKPVGKVHPLLAQAEEREEATTVATKPAKKAPPPPKPSKPEKKKPVGKVHPLLAQAEEREEATTVVAKPAQKAPPPPKPEKKIEKKKTIGKVHPLLAQAEEREEEAKRPPPPPQRKKPIPPPPPPFQETTRPERKIEKKKPIGKVHPLLAQAEEREEAARRPAPPPERRKPIPPPPPPFQQQVDSSPPPPTRTAPPPPVERPEPVPTFVAPEPTPPPMPEVQQFNFATPTETPAPPPVAEPVTTALSTAQTPVSPPVKPKRSRPKFAPLESLPVETMDIDNDDSFTGFASEHDILPDPEFFESESGTKHQTEEQKQQPPVQPALPPQPPVQPVLPPQPPVQPAPPPQPPVQPAPPPQPPVQPAPPPQPPVQPALPPQPPVQPAPPPQPPVQPAPPPQPPVQPALPPQPPVQPALPPQYQQPMQPQYQQPMQPQYQQPMQPQYQQPMYEEPVLELQPLPTPTNVMPITVKPAENANLTTEPELEVASTDEINVDDFFGGSKKVSTWGSADAQLVKSSGTSGDMEAVVIKPKATNPALEMYYKQQQLAAQNSEPHQTESEEGDYE